MTTHIKHLYENLELSLSKLHQIIDDICLGNITDITEKIDGQNFTFTVKNKVVRFLGKGIIKRFENLGGLDYVLLKEEYKNKPQEQVFINSYKLIQDFIQNHLNDDLFENGNIVVSLEIVNLSNPNVVQYKNSNLFLTRIFSKNNVLTSLKQEKINNFLISNQSPICAIPKIKINKTIIKERERLHFLLNKLGNAKNLADLYLSCVKEQLSKTIYLNDFLLEKAAKRLIFNDKKQIDKKSFCNEKLWRKFQEIEKIRSAFVNESAVSILTFFQSFGDIILSHCSNMTEIYYPEFSIEKYKKIKESFLNKKIMANNELLLKIKSSIVCCESTISTFTGSEGIIFKYDNDLFKIVGSFASLNRLLGYFRYGNEPAKIIQ